MTARKQQAKYEILRKTYPWLAYESYTIKTTENKLTIKFHFNLTGQYQFYPELKIPLNKSMLEQHKQEDLTTDPFIQQLVFNMGMIELISYWKTACPPKLIIKPAILSDHQVSWWKNIYYKGLGEFFYINTIEADPGDFMQIVSQSDTRFEKHKLKLDNQLIIPVGGGKDSVVTMELLKSHYTVVPFIINPRGASYSTTKAAGFDEADIFEVKRQIHPLLVALNKKDFLNGHTPFSAVVAFTSLLAAYLTHSKYIVLSNESSANEATIENTDINHQYSKTVSFEADFRDYVNTYISPDIEYFSFLRPLNELQIARLFSNLTHHHFHFKSCNAGSKNNAWCGRCPKCLFTYVILSPFLEQQTLEGIFHKNLFNDAELIPILEQLTGLAEEKPFECVGTLDEVNAALCKTIASLIQQKLPVVLQHYHQSKFIEQCKDENFNALGKAFDKNHFLPNHFLRILEEVLR